MICSFADCQAATLAGGKPIAGGGAEVCYHDDCVHHYLRGTQKVMCARFGRVPTGALVRACLQGGRDGLRLTHAHPTMSSPLMHPVGGAREPRLRLPPSPRA